MADIQYDPACVDCRRVGGKDPAGTTWQCNGHVRAERDWLRAKLANVMVEWEHDVEVLTKERNAARTLAEQRGAAYDMTWREVESLRERLDAAVAEAERLTGLVQGWYEGRARIGAHMTFVDQRFYDSVRCERTGWPGDDEHGDGGPPEE